MRKSNGFSARQLSDDDLHPLLCGVALVKKAQAIGISKRVLDEAKKALNVQSVKEGSQWYWQLPEKTG